MRAPKRRRPLKRKVAGISPDLDVAVLAESASYIGSPEHKNLPSFAGAPRRRSDASCCPQDLAREQEKLNEWLRAAVQSGAYSEYHEGGFPRYVWHKEGEIIFEGRLVNRGLGQYKGYPLEEDEWVEGLDELHE